MKVEILTHIEARDTLTLDTKAFFQNVTSRNGQVSIKKVEEQDIDGLQSLL